MELHCNFFLVTIEILLSIFPLIIFPVLQMNVLYKENIIKCDMVTVMISNSDNNIINNRNASYHTNKRQMQRVRQEVNKNIKQDVNTNITE